MGESLAIRTLPLGKVRIGDHPPATPQCRVPQVSLLRPGIPQIETAKIKGPLRTCAAALSLSVLDSRQSNPVSILGLRNNPQSRSSAPGCRSVQKSDGEYIGREAMRYL